MAKGKRINRKRNNIPQRNFVTYAGSIRSDGYVNNVTGLGNKTMDKLMSTTFQASEFLDDQTLENMFHDNDLAARIAEVVPDEMLRKGFDISLGRKDDEPELADVLISGLLQKLQELNTRDSVSEAMVWARVFGGAVVLMGVDDGRNVATPVNEESIKNVRYLNVLDKQCIRPVKYFTDPLKPNFGQPEIYEIQSTLPFPAGNIAESKIHRVHESRLLIFEGTRTCQRRKNRNDGWAESVYQKIDLVLKQFSTSWQSAAHLMQDAAQAVFGIRGMISMLSSNNPGDSGHPEFRMFEVDHNRSNARAVLIDADQETFERDSYSFSGVPEILQKMTLRLAAAAKLPVTILMGQSPAGLNATGESDIRAFYDTIQSAQKNDLLPQLEKLVRYCMLSSEGPTGGKEPDNWSITFPPPWQMTEKELSEIRKRQAETDGIYIDKAVLTPEEVALSRFTKPGFSPDTNVNLEIRAEIVEESVERMTEPEEPAPPQASQSEHIEEE